MTDVYLPAVNILTAVGIEPTKDNCIRLVHSFFKVGIQLRFPTWMYDDRDVTLGLGSLKVLPNNRGKPRNKETQLWLDLTMAYRDFAGKQSLSPGGPNHRFVVAAMRELGHGDDYDPDPIKLHTTVYHILRLRKAEGS